MALRSGRASAGWRTASVALALALGLPAGADEIYRWTDAQGNVHFGDRKPSGKVRDVEATDGGLVNQADDAAAAPKPAPASAKPASGTKKRESRTERMRRLARETRQAERKESKPIRVIGTSDGRIEDPDARDITKDDDWCQRTYGMSCDDLANWREKAVADCKRINSAHCDDESWIDAKKPKTIDEKNAIHEDNVRKANARANRSRR